MFSFLERHIWIFLYSENYFGFFISIYLYLFIYLGGVLDSLEPWRFLDPIFSRDSFLRFNLSLSLPKPPKGFEFSSALWKEFAEVACVFQKYIWPVNFCRPVQHSIWERGTERETSKTDRKMEQTPSQWQTTHRCHLALHCLNWPLRCEWPNLPDPRIQIYGILSYSFLVRNYIYGAGIMISLLYAFALHSHQEDGRNKERGGGGREWKKGEKWHNDVIIIIAKPGRCHGDRDMWAGRWHSQWGCSDLLFTSSTEREGVFLDKRCSDLRKGGVTQRRDGGVREK